MQPFLKDMEIQERIVQKAHDLFLRYGVRSISMDEIASRLGVSKKTIYQVYKDKNALVNSVVELVISNNTSESATIRASSKNPVHEILVAMDLVKEMLNKMNPTIMYDLQKYHPAAFKKITDHKNEFLYQVIRENLEEGIKMELYRPEINIEVIAKFRLASIFLLFSPDLFPPGNYDFGVILEELSVHFLYGITTPKGQRLVKRYYKQQEPMV